jgi:RNA polymerase sigma-70 factor (ECF subfamily)
MGCRRSTTNRIYATSLQSYNNGVETVGLRLLNFQGGVRGLHLANVRVQAHSENRSSRAAVTRPEVSDESLLDCICNGDQESLAPLFRRYARLVRGVAYRVLRDTAEADDLVQDLFLLVQRDCKTFNSSKGSVRVWILQMAYRRAISRRRYLTSRHFYTRLDLDDAACQLADPRTTAGQLEDSIDVRLGNSSLQKVFETLSENQRRTLRLFFIEGYTLDEIAATLGQSRGNVKHYYFRGLERLRKRLFPGKLIPRERAYAKRVSSSLCAGAFVANRIP